MAAAVWPLLVLVLQLATCDSTCNSAQKPVAATDPTAGIVAGETATQGAEETALALGIVRVVGSIGVLLLAWLSAGLLLILRVGVLTVRLLVLRLTVLRLGGVLLLGWVLLLLLIVLRLGSATRMGVSEFLMEWMWPEWRLTSIRHVPEGCLRHRLRTVRLVGRAESRHVAEGRRSWSSEVHRSLEERLRIGVAVAGILGCSPAAGSGRSLVGIGCMGQT